MAGRRRDDGRGPRANLSEGLGQSVDATPVTCDDGEHAHPDRPGEGIDVDGATAPGQLVGEGQDREGRAFALQHLGEHPEPAAQLRGVHQHDVPGDRRVHRLARVEDLGHHLFVWADRVEGVGAGQVLDDDLGIAVFVDSFVAGDGDAGIVAGLGAQPGQGVEQGGLAAVGAADQHEAAQSGGDGGGVLVVAGHDCTSTLEASEWRSTISVPPTLNISGSRSGARLSSVQLSPGAKPRSKSRRLITSSPSKPVMRAVAPTFRSASVLAV